MNSREQKEEFEKVAFEALRYLITNDLHLSVTDVVHQRDGQDPPDFLFRLENLQLGAEVMMIEDGYRKRWKKIEEFLNTIQEMCQTDSLQRERFCVTVYGSPCPPSLNSREGKRFIAACLERISAGLMNKDDSEELLFEDNSGSITAIFVPFNSSTPPYFVTDPAAFEAAVREEVANSVRNACVRKAEKLAKKNFPTTECILVLVDEYPFADEQNVSRDAADLKELRQFHSVVWVYGCRTLPISGDAKTIRRKCQVLYSKNISGSQLVAASQKTDRL